MTVFQQATDVPSFRKVGGQSRRLLTTIMRPGHVKHVGQLRSAPLKSVRSGSYSGG